MSGHFYFYFISLVWFEKSMLIICFFLYFVISGFLFITFGGFNVNRFAFVFKVQLL